MRSGETGYHAGAASRNDGICPGIQEANELLGMEGEATMEKLRRCFHRCALRCHPDKTQGAPGSEEGFKKLHQAFKLLEAEIMTTSCPHEGSSTARQQSSLDPFFSNEDLLLDILKRAFLGEDVSAELESLGVEQPPIGFGFAPYPPFQAGEDPSKTY